MRRCWASTAIENTNSGPKIFIGYFFEFVLRPGRNRPDRRKTRLRNLPLGLLGQTNLKRHFQLFPVKERRGQRRVFVGAGFQTRTNLASLSDHTRRQVQKKSPGQNEAV
jgi:hypothetical protein